MTKRFCGYVLDDAGQITLDDESRGIGEQLFAEFSAGRMSATDLARLPSEKGSWLYTVAAETWFAHATDEDRDRYTTPATRANLIGVRRCNAEFVELQTMFSKTTTVIRRKLLGLTEEAG